MAKKEIRYYKKDESEQGRIKKIIKNKGYGYIHVDDQHNDAIFYFSDYNKLNFNEGDNVKFTAKDSGPKTKAIKITVIDNKQKENISKNNNSGRGNQTNSSHKFFLPKDTNSLSNQIININNFALRLNKYVPFDSDFKAELKISTDITFPMKFISSISQNQDDAISKLSLSSKTNFTLRNSWRMAVGLGTESVYETSLTLHHIYGIPYIPGQALKGIARGWFIQNNIPDNFNLKQEKANDKLEETIIINHKIFRDLFGNPKVSDIKEQSGSVIFFDAFPQNPPEITKDIMTPHYGEYYGDANDTMPPADYYNPTPVLFLTVNDTTFRFTIGVKAKVAKKDAEELITKAESLLKEALTNIGVGAKTAVGYGYFE